MRLEPRYSALREPLFSRVAATTNREAQPQDVVARLDAALDEFCCLLSQHFITPPAFKALEYLIRRFKCVPCVPCVPAAGSVHACASACMCSRARLRTIRAPPRTQGQRAQH